MSAYPKYVSYDPPAELHPIERDIMSAYVDYMAHQHKEFSEQLDLARVRERQFTGVGVYTYFSIPEDAPRPPIGARARDESNLVVHQVNCSVSGGNLPDVGVAITLAYVSRGFIDCLEIASCGQGAWDGCLDGTLVWRAETPDAGTTR